MIRISKEAKETARHRLLEEAAVEFAREGFDRANINSISKAAGFAKGTVYNYFSSKEDLFGAVLEAACLRAAAGYAALPKDGSVRSRLEALALADVAVLREDEPFMKVLVRETMSFRPGTYPIIVEHLAPFVGVVGGVLAAGVGSGEIRSDRPPEELAMLFVGILALLYVQHWGSEGAWPTLEEVPELAVTTFRDGAGR
jgi:AcrR family transcriptional regulator